MNPAHPYFKQENNATCSLAILRMVLASQAITVSEKDLLRLVENEYGRSFENIWNPTIAKLAQTYGLQTSMYALWPLFKPENLAQALKDYQKDPVRFPVYKYENRHDKDNLPEPLPLAYKEMFRAIELGCHPVYGKLTAHRIKRLLDTHYYIQTSIKLHKLYPREKHAYHSLLLYGYQDDRVYYHDPYRGPSLSCTFNQLLSAASDVGAAIVYI